MRQSTALIAAPLLFAGCGRDTSVPDLDPRHERVALTPSDSTSLSAAQPLARVTGAAESPSAPANTSVNTTPIPASVVKVLEAKPYVEVDCKPVEQPGFEGHAQRCAYTAMGLEAEVLVANPSAELTSRWLMDAARSCAPLEAIRTSNTDAWERGVRAFARHLRLQSSRIFPIDGVIVEDLGDGPHPFGFDRGVVTPCTKGSCRCRVNSLTSSGLCRYRASLGIDRDVCLRTLADDEAWRAQCIENHRVSLGTGSNEHLRARAFLVGEAVKKKCDARAAHPNGKVCQPFEVVLLIEDELGLTPK